MSEHTGTAGTGTGDGARPTRCGHCGYAGPHIESTTTEAGDRYRHVKCDSCGNHVEDYKL